MRQCITRKPGGIPPKEPCPTPRSSPSKMSRDLAGLVESVFTAILLYVVVDLIVGGAIEDALVAAVSPIIGPVWALLLRVLILIAAAISAWAFIMDLVGRVRNGLGL